MLKQVDIIKNIMSCPQGNTKCPKEKIAVGGKIILKLTQPMLPSVVLELLQRYPLQDCFGGLGVAWEKYCFSQTLKGPNFESACYWGKYSRY